MANFIERDERCLFVGNLEARVTEEIIWELFSQAGPLEAVHIPKDKETGKQKTFGFVSFTNEVSIPYAISLMDSIPLYGRPITVKPGGQNSNTNSPGNQSPSNYGYPFPDDLQLRRPSFDNPNGQFNPRPGFRAPSPLLMDSGCRNFQQGFSSPRSPWNIPSQWQQKNACSGAQCCTDDALCCKQGGTAVCCDKVTMGCCGDGYGCVPPCPSQFDAIGCQLSSLSLDDKLLEARYALPENLYRILRPDEKPEGIIAKDPGAQKSVQSHVNCGSRPYYFSQFISTSASLDVAKDYKEKGEKKGLTGLRICKFDVNKLPSTCQIVDLTTEENRDKYLGNAVCKNYAKASPEVLLQCTVPIPCTAIDPPPQRDSRFVDTKHEL